MKPFESSQPSIVSEDQNIPYNKPIDHHILRMNANETTDFVPHFKHVRPITIVPAFGSTDTFGLIYEGAPYIADEFVGVPVDEHPDMGFKIFPATVDDYWHIGLFETEWTDSCWGIYRREAAKQVAASIGNNDVFDVGITFPPETGALQSCDECEYSDVVHLNAQYTRDISDISMASVEENLLRINGQPVLDDEIPTVSD